MVALGWRAHGLIPLTQATYHRHQLWPANLWYTQIFTQSHHFCWQYLTFILIISVPSIIHKRFCTPIQDLLTQIPTRWRGFRLLQALYLRTSPSQKGRALEYSLSPRHLYVGLRWGISNTLNGFVTLLRSSGHSFATWIRGPQWPRVTCGEA